MFSLRGATALVTGASSGIGQAFAAELARRGMNLLLVARSQQKLQDVAQELSTRHGVRAAAIPADLSRSDETQRVYDTVAQCGLTVDLLVNNAGNGAYGRFDVLPLDRAHDQIDLNVRAVVELTHLFLPGMLERRQGAILNVASAAGFQPLPYMAVYAATKAFVLSFSEALWAEYRDSGVRIAALCPGPVDTPFFTANNAEQGVTGPKLSPEAVVLEGLRAIERDNSYAVPGWRSYLLANGPSRLLPRSWVARIAQQMLKPKPPRR